MPEGAPPTDVALAVALVLLGFTLLEYLRHTGKLNSKRRRVALGLLLTLASLFFTTLIVRRILSFL